MNFKKLHFLIIFLILLNYNNCWGFAHEPGSLNNYYFELGLNPENFTRDQCVNYGKSIISLKQKNLTEAERLLQQNFKNKNTYVSNLLGVIYSMKKEENIAEIFFMESIKLKNDNLDPYLNAGMIFHYHKNWKKLEILSIKLLKNAPESGDALLGLGMVYYHNRKFKEAAGLLTTCRDIMKSNGNPRIEIVREYMQRVNSTRRRFFRIKH